MPPGIADATVPNPIFNLTPTATVDEGNNWINISWGPLSLINTVTQHSLGNYGPASMLRRSSTVIPSTATAEHWGYTLHPTADFYGNARKNGFVDAGAVEFVRRCAHAVATVTGGPLAFGNVVVGTTSAAQTLTLHNTGTGYPDRYQSPSHVHRAVLETRAVPAAQHWRAGTHLHHHGGASQPTAVGAATDQLPSPPALVVIGSPVTLTGTGVAAVVSATLTPTTHNYGGVTRNCPDTGLGMACALIPLRCSRSPIPGT